MASPAPQLHILFFPLMAPGHMIPMTDLATLFAHRGVKATIITTAANASLLRHTIDKANESGLPLRLLLLQFPSAEAGLPHGQENLTFVTSKETSSRFFNALEALRHPFDQLLREQQPDYVVSDMYLPWTADIANGLGIPRLVFHTMGFFPLCVLDSLHRYVANDSSDNTIVVPGLPDRIEMKRSQLHDSVAKSNEFSEFMTRMVESELKSYGAVVNSFYEMEPAYADHYKKAMGRKAWHVGPVSLCNLERGAAMAGPSEDHQRWVAWLDSKQPNSVVYVCFGSLCRLTTPQLKEISLGLEASGRSFIWVLRDDGRDGSDWLPVGGRGLIIRGWAPQVMILEHGAVGGFLSHCGWNSVVEGVSAGVPLITWPLFAEQFYNEKLVVEVLGVGVRAGVEVWSMDEEEKPVLGREEVARVVAQLMDGGDEADGVRRRAVELREKAGRAVGGSSYADMSRLIEELVTRTQQEG